MAVILSSSRIKIWNFVFVIFNSSGRCEESGYGICMVVVLSLLVTDFDNEFCQSEGPYRETGRRLGDVKLQFKCVLISMENERFELKVGAKGEEGRENTNSFKLGD